MFVSRVRLGWALAVVVVLAAALLPAAGATPREIQPSPRYAYDAVVRNAQHQRQQHAIRSIERTNPWAAYNPAHDLLLQLQLKKAQQQRQQHAITTVQPNIRR